MHLHLHPRSMFVAPTCVQSSVGVFVWMMTCFWKENVFFLSICRRRRNGWVGPAWVGRRDLAWISASSSKSFDLLVLPRHNHVLTSKRSGGKSGHFRFPLWNCDCTIMIQARLIREKTAQLDLEVEESRKVPVSFWLPDNIQTLVLQNHRKSTITPSWKIPLFQHFAREKTYYVAKIFRRAPPPAP